LLRRNGRRRARFHSSDGEARKASAPYQPPVTAMPGDATVKKASSKTSSLRVTWGKPISLANLRISPCSYPFWVHRAYFDAQPERSQDDFRSPTTPSWLPSLVRSCPTNTALPLTDGILRQQRKDGSYKIFFDTKPDSGEELYPLRDKGCSLTRQHGTQLLPLRARVS
jgi:hypothetical protein